MVAMQDESKLDCSEVIDLYQTFLQDPVSQSPSANTQLFFFFHGIHPNVKRV